MKLTKFTWQLTYEKHGILCENTHFFKIQTSQKSNILNVGMTLDDITSTAMYGLLPNFLYLNQFQDCTFFIFGLCEKIAHIFPAVVLSKHTKINICFKTKKMFFAPGEFKFMLFFADSSCFPGLQSFVQQSNLENSEVTGTISSPDGERFEASGFLIYENSATMSLYVRQKIPSHFITCKKIILTENTIEIPSVITRRNSKAGAVATDVNAWLTGYVEYCSVAQLLKFNFMFQKLPSNSVYCCIKFSFSKHPLITSPNIVLHEPHKPSNIIPVVASSLTHIPPLTAAEIQVMAGFSTCQEIYKNTLGLVFQDSLNSDLISSCQVWNPSSALKLKVYNPSSAPLVIQEHDILSYAVLLNFDQELKDATNFPSGVINSEGKFLCHWFKYLVEIPTIELPIQNFREWPPQEDSEPMIYEIYCEKCLA